MGEDSDVLSLASALFERFFCAQPIRRGYACWRRDIEGSLRLRGRPPDRGGASPTNFKILVAATER